MSLNDEIDDRCAFGIWIKSITDPAVITSPDYRECVSLHRDFHRAAAKVLALAIAGKKAEAEKAMAPGGEYGALSSNLTQAMMSWRQKTL